MYHGPIPVVHAMVHFGAAPPKHNRIISDNLKRLYSGLARPGETFQDFQGLRNYCPMDMKKIDYALAAGPALSAEQLAEVKQLRADGETLHNAGKHQESVDTLAKAMAILGIDQG